MHINYKSFLPLTLIIHSNTKVNYIIGLLNVLYYVVCLSETTQTGVAVPNIICRL